MAGRALCYWFLPPFPRVRPCYRGTTGLCLQFLGVDKWWETLQPLLSSWDESSHSFVPSFNQSIICQASGNAGESHYSQEAHRFWFKEFLSKKQDLVNMKKPKGKTERVIYRSTKPNCSSWAHIRAYGSKEGSLSTTGEGQGPGIILRGLKKELGVWFVHSFIHSFNL